jgi:hypothetical protein
VRFAALAEGFTDFGGPKPVVYLDPSIAVARLQFTFAHELGHVLLRCDAAESLWAPYANARDEERMCDRIAAALLMPEKWLDELTAGRPGLRGLSDAADDATVSLSALVAQLSSYHTDHVLLRFRRGPSGRWVPVARIGMPFALRGPMRLTPCSAALLDASAERDLDRGHARDRNRNMYRRMEQQLGAELDGPGTSNAAMCPCDAWGRGELTNRGDGDDRGSECVESHESSVYSMDVIVGRFVVRVSGEVRRSKDSVLLLARRSAIQARRLPSGSGEWGSLA